MRHSLLLLALVTSMTTRAQEMKLPGWMLEALASPARDSLFEHRMNAAFGLDSLHTNRFIGSYAGTFTPKGVALRADFNCWMDTTRGIVELHMKAEDKPVTMIYMADLPTNTATLAVSNNKDSVASIHTLNELLLTNVMMRGMNKGPRTVPGRGKRTIAGEQCKESLVIEHGDTTHIWVSRLKPSPYTDAWNWMPLGQPMPFMVFALMDGYSDYMAMMLESEEMTLEITSLKRGPQPRPSFDLRRYSVTDKRKESTRAVPLTNAPLRGVGKQSADARADDIDAGKGSGDGGSSTSIALAAGAAIPAWIKMDLTPELRVLRVPNKPQTSYGGAVKFRFVLKANGEIDLGQTSVVKDTEEGKEPSTALEQKAFHLLRLFRFQRPPEGKRPAGVLTLTFDGAEAPPSEENPQIGTRTQEVEEPVPTQMDRVEPSAPAPASFPHLEDAPVKQAEVMAQFPGGEAAMQTNLATNVKYPVAERENQIEGKVFIRFVVEKDGSITHVEVLRGVQGGPGLSKEAVRVITAMPNWVPGMQNGKAVRMLVTVPVQFRLNK